MPEAFPALGVGADQHLVLQRIATLVAHDAVPRDVFPAIAEEMGRVSRAHSIHLARFDPGGVMTIVSGWAARGYVRYADGGRHPVASSRGTATLVETGHPVILDDVPPADTALPRVFARMHLGAVTYLPLLVRGRLWGEVMIGAEAAPVLAPGSESFVREVLELIAIAIDNAEMRVDLIASRRRLVEASDRARRQIERDLHDGAQQRFVSLAVALQLVERVLQRGDTTQAGEVLRETTGSLRAGLHELGELSAGIHPRLLARDGLGSAITELVQRSRLTAELELTIAGRFDEAAEIAAYYVVSEALTNVAKHARSTHVMIAVSSDADHLFVVIDDDGRGGAVLDAGTGLSGLVDRLHAVGGTLDLHSPPGGGTRLQVVIPLSVVTSAA